MKVLINISVDETCATIGSLFELSILYILLTFFSFRIINYLFKAFKNSLVMSILIILLL
jgi:hypothetical protein